MRKGGVALCMGGLIVLMNGSNKILWQKHVKWE